MSADHSSFAWFRDEHCQRGGGKEFLILPDAAHSAAPAASARPSGTAGHTVRES